MLVTPLYQEVSSNVQFMFKLTKKIFLIRKQWNWTLFTYWVWFNSVLTRCSIFMHPLFTFSDSFIPFPILQKALYCSFSPITHLVSAPVVFWWAERNTSNQQQFLDSLLYFKPYKRKKICISYDLVGKKCVNIYTNTYRNIHTVRTSIVWVIKFMYYIIIL